MNAEFAALRILLDDATVSGLVGTNVHLYEVPQGTEAPYVILELTDTEPFPTKSGASVANHCRVSAFSYASDPKAAKNLANAVKSALDEESGIYNGVDVVKIRYQSETGFSEEINNVNLFAREQEFLVRVKQ
jgi:hypothetical protein